MPERHKSHDGVQETREFTDTPATPSHQGRSEGELERSVGSRDERNQALQGDSKTRVTKEDEKGRGKLGGLHGTGDGDEES